MLLFHLFLKKNICLTPPSFVPLSFDNRFDRSSRMSTMRTTRILAAGKTLRRPTPEGRLQRKMAARSAVTAKQAAPSTTFLVSPRSLLLPAPRITAKQDGDPSCANSGRFAAVHRAEKDGPVHGGGDNSGPGTVYLGESGAVVAARDSEEQKSTTGARHPQGTCGDVAAAGRSPTNNRTNHNATGSSDNVDDVDHDDDRDKPNHGQNEIRDDSKRSDGRDGCSPRRDPATVPLPWKKADGAPDAIARSSGAEEEKDCPPPAPEKEGVETTLGGVGQGPMRDVLAALLTSTVMTEDGGRVLVPTFPTISALQELKYCGPVEPLQASVLQRVLLARCALNVVLRQQDNFHAGVYSDMPLGGSERTAWLTSRPKKPGKRSPTRFADLDNIFFCWSSRTPVCVVRSSSLGVSAGSQTSTPSLGAYKDNLSCFGVGCHEWHCSSCTRSSESRVHGSF